MAQGLPLIRETLNLTTILDFLVICLILSYGPYGRDKLASKTHDVACCE